MAIGSLVASVVGVCCGIGSIVGIVLGIVAMNQIKQTGENGHGLAIAGIAVGVLSLLINVAWTIGAKSYDSGADETTRTTRSVAASSTRAGEPAAAGSVRARDYPPNPACRRRSTRRRPDIRARQGITRRTTRIGRSSLPARMARRSPRSSRQSRAGCAAARWSIVGLILGVIAMRETKRTGQEGYGLALAGAIIGGLVARGRR